MLASLGDHWIYLSTDRETSKMKLWLTYDGIDSNGVV